MKSNPSKTVLFICIGLSIILSACGASAPAATPTLTSTITLTPSPIPTATSTLTPTKTLTPTVTPNLTATRQYEDFLSIVQKYYDAGILPSVNGKYQSMGDYFDSSIDAGTYRWKTYDNEIGNFIVRANVTLETAPSPASQSGCGFIFDVISDEYHEFVFLQRNGSAIYGLGGRPFTTKYYDKLQNPAEFTMLLVVYKEKLRLIINDKEIITYNSRVLTDGGGRAWGPALLSGSTQDFGTRCNFKNIELWKISDS